MNKSLKRLLEGSPSKFFDDIRAKLDGKASTIVESVASTVADTVFEEQEQLNELSRDTLASYTRKSAADMAGARENSQRYFGQKQKEKTKLRKDIFQDFENIENDKIRKRWKGIQTATKQLAKEEVEPLDELSKATLGSYADKASRDTAGKAYFLGKDVERNSGSETSISKNEIKKQDDKILSRQKYTSKAISKITKEEVEPVAEDLGVHRISTTRGGKNPKTFATLVVNKKRVSATDKDRKWKDLIKKATPKETEWDKLTKQ